MNHYGEISGDDPNSTNVLQPVRIIESGVIDMAIGRNHSLFIKSDNTLWGMGLNAHGQLGEGNVTSCSSPIQIDSNVAKVTCGVYRSLFIKTDGSLWGMGRNTYGGLGDGSTTDDVEDTETVNIIGGTNITVELSGDREISIENGITNNNQLTNGAGYLTSLPSTINATTVDASVLEIDNNKVLDMPNNSTQRGPWNPIAAFVRGSGTAIYGDEDFVSGSNNVYVTYTILS